MQGALLRGVKIEARKVQKREGAEGTQAWKTRKLVNSSGHNYMLIAISFVAKNSCL